MKTLIRVVTFVRDTVSGRRGLGKYNDSEAHRRVPRTSDVDVRAGYVSPIKNDSRPGSVW